MSTSAKIKQLADHFGMTTADKAPRPAPKPAATAPRKQRDRRSPEWWKAFRDIAPAAVYVCGHAAPVPRRFADNRGVWPVKIGITTRWETLDVLSSEMDRHHAVHWMGMWFRVWTLAGEQAGQLAFLLANAIADTDESAPASREAAMLREIVRFVRADKLRRGFVDVGPDFDIASIDSDKMRKQLQLPPAESMEQNTEQHYQVVRAKLELAVHHLAGDNCIQAWDDEGFAAHVDGVAMRQAKRRLGEG